jgi:peptidoglycan/LPS O-acetylase OafA/YrhL
MSVSATRAALPVLTSLRFFAAAEVVVYHQIADHIENDFLRGLGSAGYEAVTFFFVLSGFILTYVYTGRSEQDYLNVSAREFWKARIARILPAYFLGLVLSLPRVAYYALIYKMIIIQPPILGFVLVPILLQAWWPPAAMAWNSPAWSLSVELFFYVSFPMLARAAGRLSRNYFIVLAYGLVVAVVVLRHAVSSPNSTFGTAAWNFDMFFPLFHLPQFIFGMALGRLYLFGPTVSPKIHMTMLCIGTLGLVLVFGGHSLLPSWTKTDATLVLLFGLVIFGGAQAEGTLKALACPALILLGEASYSIYILHVPLGYWWSWITRGLALPAIASFGAYFALVIVASILSYLYVEKPLRRRILGHCEHRAA